MKTFYAVLSKDGAAEQMAKIGKYKIEIPLFC